MRHINSFAIIITLAFLPAALFSQVREPATPFASASAGLFFGDVSGYNGPLLLARYGEQFNQHFMWAARAQFRDDDPSGGRVQSLGFGGELFAVLPLDDTELYGLGGIVLEAVHLGSTQWLRIPDMETGVYLRPHVGAGVSIPAGSVNLLFELNRGFASGPNYWFGSFGARSNRTETDSGGTAFHVYANHLAPIGGNYESEEDYRGYTIAVDVQRKTPFGHAMRYSLGIDFVDFGTSTGIVEFLVGTVGDIVRVEDGAFTLSWVPQLGAVLFAEGASRPYPMGLLGIEARGAHHGVAVFVGTSALAAQGPDGVLRGLQVRFGASVLP